MCRKKKVLQQYIFKSYLLAVMLKRLEYEILNFVCISFYLTNKDLSLFQFCFVFKYIVINAIINMGLEEIFDCLNCTLYILIILILLFKTFNHILLM